MLTLFVLKISVLVLGEPFPLWGNISLSILCSWSSPAWLSCSLAASVGPTSPAVGPAASPPELLWPEVMVASRMWGIMARNRCLRLALSHPYRMGLVMVLVMARTWTTKKEMYSTCRKEVFLHCVSSYFTFCLIQGKMFGIWVETFLITTQ